MNLGSVKTVTPGIYANLVGNDHPATLSPAHFGCGEYVAWLAYESVQLAREQRAEREERFCPFDGYEPESAPPVYPWVAERMDRLALESELMQDGLRGVELDDAIDLTMFARRFARWAEDGFPLTKG